MKDKTLILASASPRRRKILSDMGLEFVVMPSSFEEKLSSSDFAYKKIENLAFQKGKSLLKEKELKNSLILSADTIVVLDNKILGKPKNKNHAFEMLRSLSNKTHFVVTSICLLDSDTDYKKIESTTSYVTFNDLSDEQINYYIEKFNPLDKAGSYGIQEMPEGYIKTVEGDFENIIGLSSQSVKNLLTYYEQM